MTGDRKAAADSLRGLALGDGFGERWFHQERNRRAIAMIKRRETPAEAPFHYTDDTAMALAVLRVLDTSGRISGEYLARMFAATYQADPYRGFGYGMHELLPRLAEAPEHWPSLSRALFDGAGSLGNGAAMRVALLGAWFHADLDEVAEQAARSAEVTHGHPEGIAGAVAVAIAAALAARSRGAAAPSPDTVLRRVAQSIDEPTVRAGLDKALDVPGDTPAWKASDILGNGQRIRAADTVPFAVWCAAHHLDSLEDTLWTTAEGLGDVDTTCAIAGGIVGARTGIGAVPKLWLELREQLPSWAEQM